MHVPCAVHVTLLVGLAKAALEPNVRRSALLIPVMMMQRGCDEASRHCGQSGLKGQAAAVSGVYPAVGGAAALACVCDVYRESDVSRMVGCLSATVGMFAVPSTCWVISQLHANAGRCIAAVLLGCMLHVSCVCRSTPLLQSSSVPNPSSHPRHVAAFGLGPVGANGVTLR
jgi:hypothetical protein